MLQNVYVGFRKIFAAPRICGNMLRDRVTVGPATPSGNRLFVPIFQRQNWNDQGDRLL